MAKSNKMKRENCEFCKKAERTREKGITEIFYENFVRVEAYNIVIYKKSIGILVKNHE